MPRWPTLYNALGISMIFSLLKSKSVPPAKKLFRITVHVGRGTNTDMPQSMVGAFVPVFVGAVDHEQAAHLVVGELRRRGFEFIDIADQKIHEMDATKWDIFVAEAWPEFSSHFPTQREVLSKLPLELLFTGPFAGYNEQSDAQPGAAADGFAAR